MIRLFITLLILLALALAVKIFKSVDGAPKPFKCGDDEVCYCNESKDCKKK